VAAQGRTGRWIHEGARTQESRWYEQHESADSAITREKQIKKWNREWKIRLIEKNNPYWNDLYPEING